MSIRTNFKVNNVNYNNTDLCEIFNLYNSGTKVMTGYKVNNQHFSNKDLADIFQPYTSGVKAKPTGFLVNKIDLSDIFEAKTISIQDT